MRMKKSTRYIVGLQIICLSSERLREKSVLTRRRETNLGSSFPCVRSRKALGGWTLLHSCLYSQGAGRGWFCLTIFLLRRAVCLNRSTGVLSNAKCGSELQDRGDSVDDSNLLDGDWVKSTKCMSINNLSALLSWLWRQWKGLRYQKQWMCERFQKNVRPYRRSCHEVCNVLCYFGEKEQDRVTKIFQ